MRLENFSFSEQTQRIIYAKLKNKHGKSCGKKMIA